MATEDVESPVMQTFDFEKMKKLREHAGLNQATAAERAGMSVSRWSDIESGKRVNVTIETMGRIADALKCNSLDLLTAPARKKK